MQRKMQLPTFRPSRQVLTISAALALTAFIFFICVNVLEEEWEASKAVVKGWAASISAAGQGTETERVVFALIMVGLESAVEGAMGIKTAIYHTSGPLSFHLIVDEPAHAHLLSVISLITRPQWDIEVVFHPLSKDAMAKRLERTGWLDEQGQKRGSIRSTHMGGLGGMMKLFLHEILPADIDRAIFFDTDAMLIVDPYLVWKQFNTFSHDTLFSIPTHEGSERPDVKSDWQGASRVCSCVLLLDLRNMRAAPTMNSELFEAGMQARALERSANEKTWGDAFGEFGSKDGKTYRGVALGDQGYFWALRQYVPDKVPALDLSYEVTSCLFGQYNVGLHGNANVTVEDQVTLQSNLAMTPNEGKLVLPSILHFNCMGGWIWDSPRFHGHPQDIASRGWQDDMADRWGDAVRYFWSYKYIWFNRGDGTAKMTVVVKRDLRFWDERLSGREVAEGYGEGLGFGEDHVLVMEDMPQWYMSGQKGMEE